MSFFYGSARKNLKSKTTLKQGKIILLKVDYPTASDSIRIGKVRNEAFRTQKGGSF